MPEPAFDIYETQNGYVAVTNDVRRTILDALADEPRQLPDLVTLTGKAKPTLSSVHMRELLHQGLVEERTHPRDKRKKIYTLRARRIGSSALQVDQLRSAVRQYASAAPAAAHLPLRVSLAAMAAAPPETPLAALEAQARRLGGLAAPLFGRCSARELVTALSSFLDREGLARPLRLNLEDMTLEIEAGETLSEEVEAEKVAAMLAAFVHGVVHAASASDVTLKMRKGRRLTLALTAASE